MGHASSELSELDHQTSDPPALPPAGLVLIAHGGPGGTIDCPVVSALATCLRERHGCRIVTWRTHEIADSRGVNDSAYLGLLIRNKGSNDYKVSRDVRIVERLPETCNSYLLFYPLQTMLQMAMEGFARDVPCAEGAGSLFV